MGSLLKIAAAILFLNIFLVLELPGRELNWTALLRVSPDFLVLLAGMSLLVRSNSPFRRQVYGPIIAALVLLRLFHSAESLVPMVFSRQFNLYMDSRSLPDFVYLLWRTRSPQWFVLAGSGILVSSAVLVFCLWRSLQVLHGGLAVPGMSRSGIRWVTAVLTALAWVAVPIGVPTLQGSAALPRVAQEIGFILNLDDVRQRDQSVIQAAMERARRTPSDLKRLNGASVFLVVVESYGLSAFSDPRHSRLVLPATQAAEAELRQAGFNMCSAYLTAPTFGGGSWLSHATLASGVHVGSQIRHDLLLMSDLVPLAEYFNQAGYRTVRAMPGTQWPWPAGAFYRYDRSYYAPDFDYRGPRFGFASMPDQYVMDWVYRKESTRPLFAEFILISSHAAFDVQAPYIDEWDRIGDGSIFNALEPATFPVAWSDLSQASNAYSAAVIYEITVITEFIRNFLAADELIIILGDHQPPAEIAGQDQPWSVPVHVVSRKLEHIQPFLRKGYTEGLVPDHAAEGRPLAGMETLFWDILEGFSGG